MAESVIDGGKQFKVNAQEQFARAQVASALAFKNGIEQQTDTIRQKSAAQENTKKESRLQSLRGLLSRIKK
jgi:hypothetical protein